MSATVTANSNLAAYLAALVEGLDPKVARGAVRAGAVVIADLAREECRSEEVAASIGVVTDGRTPGVVTAKVQTKGPGAYIAPWEEFGTAPHYISVDPAQSGGMTARKINDKIAKGTLTIGGQPVGKTVHHPGARAHPFMRPAADNGQAPAIDAMGAYIVKRTTPQGLAEPAEQEDGGE